MKKLLAILIIFCLLGGLLIGGIVKLIFNFLQQNKQANSKGKFRLPKTTLTTLAETEINFHTITQPTILFFWLPQSNSCQLQLSTLAQINQNYNLKIISIGIGAIDQAQFRKIKQKKKVNFPFVIDQKTNLTQKLNITTIPTLIFYQPSTPPQTITGFQSKTKLKKLINNYFKQQINKR